MIAAALSLIMKVTVVTGFAIVAGWLHGAGEPPSVI